MFIGMLLGNTFGFVLDNVLGSDEGFRVQVEFFGRHEIRDRIFGHGTIRGISSQSCLTCSSP